MMSCLVQSPSWQLLWLSTGEARGNLPLANSGFPSTLNLLTLLHQTIGMHPGSRGGHDTWIWSSKREVQERGPRSHEEDELVDFYLNKAIPRYIRPLESGGRSIQPTLLHTDLWPGNVKFKLDNETVCIFDANAMWGHNESKCELGSPPLYPHTPW